MGKRRGKAYKGGHTAQAAKEGKQWKKTSNGRRQAMEEDKQLKKTSNGERGTHAHAVCGHVPAVAPTDTNTISMYPMQIVTPCTPMQNKTTPMHPMAKHNTCTYMYKNQVK